MMIGFTHCHTTCAIAGLRRAIQRRMRNQSCPSHGFIHLFADIAGVERLTCPQSGQQHSPEAAGIDDVCCARNRGRRFRNVPAERIGHRKQSSAASDDVPPESLVICLVRQHTAAPVAAALIGAFRLPILTFRPLCPLGGNDLNLAPASTTSPTAPAELHVLVG